MKYLWITMLYLGLFMCIGYTVHVTGSMKPLLGLFFLVFMPDIEIKPKFKTNNHEQ